MMVDMCRFSSAASSDPTFWSLHGAAERMVSYKRLKIADGTITDFDETWGYPEYDRTSGAAYLEGRCDWSKVTSNDDLTLPECDRCECSVFVCISVGD